MKNRIDMLNGPLMKNILLYTLPVIATGVLQLLFNAADLIVVGQFCGSKCIAAVGATGSLVNLIVNFFIGFSVGGGVIVAQNMGKKRYDTVSQSVHTSMLLAVFCGIILTAIGLIVSKWALGIMNTPEDVIDLSALYLKIYFIGSVPNLIYNFGAAILRAVGDTKYPLIFLSIGGIVNIILNFLFVTLFGMDVDGVATATVISQTISALFIVRALMKRTDACKLILKNLKISWKRVGEMFKIGIPAGLQSSVFSISNVIIQSSVNSFGAIALSGHAAAQSIDGFVMAAANSFDQPSMNFTAQNYGAGNFKRIKRIVITSMLCATMVGLTVGLGIFALGKPLLSIYINDSAEAISYGMLRLGITAPLYFLCAIMNVLGGAVRGLGHSFAPMVNAVFGACVLRIVFIFTLFKLPAYHSLQALYFSYPVTWIITCGLQAVTLIIVLKKIMKSHVPLNSAET